MSQSEGRVERRWPANYFNREETMGYNKHLIKEMGVDDWNNFDTVPPTHFDGTTDKEIAEAAKRADAVKPERGRAICEEALKTINGERQDAYGNPEDSFGMIASMWSAYLGIEVMASEVAHMMCLLKIARERGGKGKRDNLVDLIGYAALASHMRGYDK